MWLGLLIMLTTTLGASAKDEPWPTAGDLSVGDTFKYPILGTQKGEMRPTQAAVGAMAVRVKAEKFDKMGKDELKEALEKEPIPVVAGPDGNFYMIDHHHQALAAHKAGRENAYYLFYKDYTKLPDMNEFWSRMKKNHWVREFDHQGLPIQIPEGLPTSLLKLRDDPFRSLAWFVRRAGGYRKTAVEFAEFQWADFFRTRISLENTKEGFQKATREGEAMAHTDAARGLPGWTPKTVDCSSCFDPEPRSLDRGAR